MWKLWPALKWILLAVVVTTILGVGVNLLFQDVRVEFISWVTDDIWFPISSLSFIAFLIVCLLSYRSDRKKQSHDREERLKQEFDLFVASEDLRPEHFGFESLPIGKLPIKRRPHYPPYINRKAVLFEERHSDTALRLWTESDLAKELSERRGFILIGEPTAGKSRLLLHVIQGMSGFTVIRPRSEQAPGAEALAMLDEKQVILLLDDLNHFVGAKINLLSLLSDLDSHSSRVTIAAACRDGSEHARVREAVETSLKRFYEEFPLKMAMLQPSQEEKQQLHNEIQPHESKSQQLMLLYPTLGSICMENALQFMRDRFNNLSGNHQDCLRAMQLLIAAGISPLTHVRVKMALESVFGRGNFQLRDILKLLGEQGFIYSEESDPVLPEPAYLIGRVGEEVVSYYQNRKPDDDLQKLIEPLSRIHDAEGIISLGVMFGESRRLDESLRTFDIAIDTISSNQELSSLNADETMLLALYNKGVTLGQLDQNENAIRTYNDLINRFGESQLPALQEQVAKALYSKGYRLGQLNQSEKAIDAYDDLTGKFGDSQLPQLQKLVAKALCSKGITLGQLDKSEKAIEAYDALIRKFGDSQLPQLQEQVAKALYNKGYRLGQLDQNENAIGTYNNLINRFGESQLPALQEQVAMALYNKGYRLGQLNQCEKAIDAYDDLIGKFGDSQLPQLQKLVAKALLSKGITLGQLNQSEKEIEAYGDLIKRYGVSQLLALQERVAKALYNKGITLGQLIQSEKEIEAYDDLIRRFGDSQLPALQEWAAKAFAARGFALIDVERKKEARLSLTEAMKRMEYLTEEQVKTIEGALEMLNKNNEK